MITPIVVSCDNATSCGKFDVLLSEPLDCSPGYQVSLSNVMYTAGSIVDEKSVWWVQAKLGNEYSHRVYMQPWVYKTKHELIAYINVNTRNFLRARWYYTYREGKTNYRVFRTKKAFKMYKWPEVDSIKIEDSKKYGELFIDGEVHVNSWDSVEPIENAWSDESFNRFSIRGGCFLYVESSDWFSKVYDLAKSAGLITAQSLDEFKKNYEYINPRRDLSLASLASDNAKLVWYPYDYDKATEVVISDELAYVLGFTNRRDEQSYYIVNDLMQNLSIANIDVNRNSLNKLFVFADFVKPTIVGPFMKKLLKIIPLYTDYGLPDYRSFEHESYMDVERRVINKLQFYITTSLTADEAVLCKNSVTFVLYFRPIQ